MTAQRFGRAQKAATLVPLALLSAAWTASLAGVGVGTSASAADESGVLPDGTTIPTEALEAPASLSDPTLGLGLTSGSTDRIVRTSTTNGIPAAALAAYQRAETVINAADRGCNLPWQLVAAIGRVESDHGRYGGNTLGADGIARPGIVGVALNGKDKTQAIRDTDAGQYDSDAVWDRAVGPMQFIPSTWSVVGVDADGDARRNPQDIDDAALATAVYLCSGDDDLATDAGRRAAVYRYNHSQEYVDLVLRIMAAYTDGDYTAVPTNTTSAVTFTPDYDFSQPVLVTKGGGSTKGGGTGGGGSTTGGGGATDGGGSTGDGDGGTGVPTDGPSSPVDDTVDDVEDTVTQAPVAVLSLAEATTLCANEFAKIPDPLNQLGPLVDDCAARVQGKTRDVALSLIPNTLSGILAWLL